MNYEKLTAKDLIKLKEFRIKRMNEFMVKVESYRQLIREVNNEQVMRLLPKLRKEKS